MAEIEYQLIYVIIAVFIMLILTVIWFLSYCGLFTKIEVNAGKPPFDNLYVAYKFKRGPYKNSGEIFTETNILAPNCRCFGIYYDDPQEVAPQDLKYIVGAVLAEGDAHPDEILRDKMRSEGYTLTTFPAIAHAVVTSFPYKNSISIFIAILRVYPYLAEYIKSRKLSARPCIELYEKGIIHFVMPLARQSEFYVNEALDNGDLEGESADSLDDETLPSIGDDSGHEGDVTVPEHEISLSKPKHLGGRTSDGDKENGAGSNGSMSSYEVLEDSNSQE